MSNNITKISEEQARDMLNIIKDVDVNGISLEDNIKDIIRVLKEKGYIEETTREKLNKYLSIHVNSLCDQDEIKACKVFNVIGLYEQYIREILNK